MKVAIMQPYIYPYIGYFQLISAVDKFVVYDNIQYTKKGWINRNRILLNGKDEYITITLKKDSDYLDVAERTLAESYIQDNQKLLRKIKGAYMKAPEFNNVFPLIEKGLSQAEPNLFLFLFNILKDTLQYLDIHTELIISSAINIDHSLRSQEKVLAICKYLEASAYVNPIGGVELYSKDVFKDNNIQLSFIRSDDFEYKQFENSFVPWLSIIDVLMFNNKETIRQQLKKIRYV